MKSVIAFLSSSTFFALAVLASAVALLCTKVVSVNEALPLVAGLMAALKVAASVDNHAQATLDAAAPPAPPPAAAPTPAQALAVLGALVPPPAPPAAPVTP